MKSSDLKWWCMYSAEFSQLTKKFLKDHHIKRFPSMRCLRCETHFWDPLFFIFWRKHMRNLLCVFNTFWDESRLFVLAIRKTLWSWWRFIQNSVSTLNNVMGAVSHIVFLQSGKVAPIEAATTFFEWKLELILLLIKWEWKSNWF